MLVSSQGEGESEGPTGRDKTYHSHLILNCWEESDSSFPDWTDDSWSNLGATKSYYRSFSAWVEMRSRNHGRGNQSIEARPNVLTGEFN